ATIFSFPLIQAQYARIDVANNWFVGWTAPGPIGLSEVRFAQTVPVPESSSGLGLLALGLLGTAAAFKRHLN
ncbi:MULTISPECIES: PEP-CTERM sorting domain-containing protein, partial [unclassified Microcystis]